MKKQSNISNSGHRRYTRYKDLQPYRPSPVPMPDNPITVAPLPPYVKAAEEELEWGLLDSDHGFAESLWRNFMKDRRDQRFSNPGWSIIKQGQLIGFNDWIDTHVSVSNSTR
jgi:hypothetical protein